MILLLWKFNARLNARHAMNFLDALITNLPNYVMTQYSRKEHWLFHELIRPDYCTTAIPHKYSLYFWKLKTLSATLNQVAVLKKMLKREMEFMLDYECPYPPTSDVNSMNFGKWLRPYQLSGRFDFNTFIIIIFQIYVSRWISLNLFQRKH